MGTGTEDMALGQGDPRAEESDSSGIRNHCSWQTRDRLAAR